MTWCSDGSEASQLGSALEWAESPAGARCSAALPTLMPWGPLLGERLRHRRVSQRVRWVAWLAFPCMLIVSGPWSWKLRQKPGLVTWIMCLFGPWAPLPQSVPVNPADSFNTTLFLSHLHKIPCQGTNHSPLFLGSSCKNYFRLNLNVKPSRTLSPGGLSSVISQQGQQLFGNSDQGTKISEVYISPWI